MDENNHKRRSEQNRYFELAIVSDIGDRPEQQDYFSYLIDENRIVVSVCDGMGGYNGGAEASKVAANTFIDFYQKLQGQEEPYLILKKAVSAADRKIFGFVNKDGRRINAGSTTVTIVVSKNQLYWASVGDSRLYIYRAKEFLQITRDQNYESVLAEWLQRGEISPEYYSQEKTRGEELISYLGIGKELPIDYNEEPLRLKKDDYVVLMTDGLYRMLDDEHIKEIFEKSNNIAEAVSLLESQSKMAASIINKKRDNTTVAIIRIKEES
jgi:protein phosphatase